VDDDFDALTALSFEAINAAEGRETFFFVIQNLSSAPIINSLQVRGATSPEEEDVADASEHDWLHLRVSIAADESAIAALVVVKGDAVLVEVDELVVDLEVQRSAKETKVNRGDSTERKCLTSTRSTR
jgi:hypothetical protein